jgi:hypothetical protein
MTLRPSTLTATHCLGMVATPALADAFRRDQRRYIPAPGAP